MHANSLQPEQLLVLCIHQDLFPVLVTHSLEVHLFPRKVHTRSGPVESPQAHSVTAPGRAPPLAEAERMLSSPFGG